MIKKILILTAFLMFVMNPVKANNSNFSNYCPAVPKQNFKVSKVTGMNWLTEKIAQGIIKRELKKETKGKFKVSIKSSGTSDLINGKFNSLSLNGKNLNIDGAHISQFTSNTVCGYNSVKINKDSIQFIENMVLNYELKIDNDALSQTLNDTKYLNILKGMGFPLNNVTSQIKNNKIYFIFEIPTFITKPIQLTLSSGLAVKNGKIQLDGISVINSSNLNVKKLISILEKTNPITFTSDIMNNNDSKIYVDSVKILNNTIVIKGLVLIPKNV